MMKSGGPALESGRALEVRPRDDKELPRTQGKGTEFQGERPGKALWGRDDQQEGPKGRLGD